MYFFIYLNIVTWIVWLFLYFVVLNSEKDELEEISYREIILTPYELTGADTSPLKSMIDATNNFINTNTELLENLEKTGAENINVQSNHLGNNTYNVQIQYQLQGYEVKFSAIIQRKTLFKPSFTQFMMPEQLACKAPNGYISTINLADTSETRLAMYLAVLFTKSQEQHLSGLQELCSPPAPEPEPNINEDIVNQNNDDEDHINTEEINDTMNNHEPAFSSYENDTSTHIEQSQIENAIPNHEINSDDINSDEISPDDIDYDENQ